jgi:DDE superfamily endonuclease
MILQNASCSYPIRNLPNNIPAVSYRTGKLGWMDQRVMTEYLCDPRAIRRDSEGRQRVLFLDNCGGHNSTEDSESALAKIKTVVRFFPKNSTQLTQPADSFVIQKIKAAWSRWDKKKLEMIQNGEWKNGAVPASGKLNNPGNKSSPQARRRFCSRRQQATRQERYHLRP